MDILNREKHRCDFEAIFSRAKPFATSVIFEYPSSSSDSPSTDFRCDLDPTPNPIDVSSVQNYLDRGIISKEEHAKCLLFLWHESGIEEEITEILRDHLDDLREVKANQKAKEYGFKLIFSLEYQEKCKPYEEFHPLISRPNHLVFSRSPFTLSAAKD